MSERHRLSRRESLKGLGLAGAAAFCGVASSGVAADEAKPPRPSGDIREKIFAKVRETPFIDTHEHLCEEADRLTGKDPFGGADDWTVVLSHYLNSDLLTAGMPSDAQINSFRRPPRPAKNGNC